MALLTSVAAGFQSCVSDEPFADGGQGSLRLKLIINNDVTRAETDGMSLSESCVLYISGQKGLLHKFKGLENVPDRITLRSGSYLAEAWAGDSVPAAFDKKFYKGQKDFEISGAETAVELRCGIANVVTSVNQETVNDEVMKNYNVTFEIKDYKPTQSHAEAKLALNADNIADKCYFMMPSYSKTIVYTIEGDNVEGNHFSVSGEIPDAKGGHEYKLNLAYNPSYEEIGGAFITVTVDDTEILVEDEIEIFGRPDIKGEEFNIDKQVVGNAGQFSEKIVRVRAFGGIKSLVLTMPRYAEVGLPTESFDLLNLTENADKNIRAKGIDWDIVENVEKKYTTSYIYFRQSFLNSLPESDDEYIINVRCDDGHGKSFTKDLRIAVGQGAIKIDDPVVLDEIAANDYLSIRSRSAVLTGKIVTPDVVAPSLQYRASGDSEWKSVSLETIQASMRRNPRKAADEQGFRVTLRELAPATRYEVRVAAEGFTSESRFITTESVFTIPNASFEEWSTYQAKTMLGVKTVIFPGTGSEPTFWDSGNEGAATASNVLTDKSTDMVHSGTYAARLESKSIFNMMAAGNIFFGDYVRTDGTNGVLSLGRDYDGSHPDKVRVWANYRPGTNVSIMKGNESFVGDLKNGGTDQGQIYVALSTEKVEIRTNPNNRKLFNPDDPEILAYGQVTWKEAFGDNGALKLLEIPFTYNDRAKNQKPKYLIIVASASKYGDYFSGSAGSVIYLDDFELIYE